MAVWCGVEQRTMYLHVFGHLHGVDYYGLIGSQLENHLENIPQCVCARVQRKCGHRGLCFKIEPSLIAHRPSSVQPHHFFINRVIFLRKDESAPPFLWMRFSLFVRIHGVAFFTTGFHRVDSLPRIMATCSRKRFHSNEGSGMPSVSWNSSEQ
mmetsp:Transcript_13238/g.36566  ORF Transcript_13238/g.36566 Transcript_13238/m.36566 type:complete len:153 (+) Transcript_13238:100-558(+)